MNNLYLISHRSSNFLEHKGHKIHYGNTVVEGKFVREAVSIFLDKLPDGTTDLTILSIMNLGYCENQGVSRLESELEPFNE